MKGIAHRDIKPQNFMMLDNSNESEVKLIDFGLSKQFSGENDQVENRSMKTVVGTPLYVAPEIFKGFILIQLNIFSLIKFYLFNNQII